MYSMGGAQPNVAREIYQSNLINRSGPLPSCLLVSCPPTIGPEPLFSQKELSCTPRSAHLSNLQISLTFGIDFQRFRSQSAAWPCAALWYPFGQHLHPSTAPLLTAKQRFSSPGVLSTENLLTSAKPLCRVTHNTNRSASLCYRRNRLIAIDNCILALSIYPSTLYSLQRPLAAVLEGRYRLCLQRC